MLVFSFLRHRLAYPLIMLPVSLSPIFCHIYSELRGVFLSDNVNLSSEERRGRCGDCGGQYIVLVGCALWKFLGTWSGEDGARAGH